MVLVQHSILEGQVTGATVWHQELLDRLMVFRGLMKVLWLAICQTTKAAIARFVLFLAVLLNLTLCGPLTGAHALQVGSLAQCNGAHRILVGA